MSPLRTLSRDLIERRLWPLVAVLVAALVAIPALFLHSASSDGTQAAATAPVPAPATTAASVPTSVPRAVRQLIDQTTATIAHAKVSGPIKDPFRLAETNGLSPTAPPPASSTPSTTSAAAASVPSGPSGTPASPSAGGSAGSHGGSSTPPSDGPKPGAPPKPVTPPDQPTKKSFDVYRTDLEYGIGDAKPKLLTDAVRLTAFPTSLNPVAVFLGVESGGRDAVFAIRSDSRPTGDRACRPLPGTCLWLVVAPGKSVTLNVPDAKGATTPEVLTVVRIARTTTSDSAAAMAAYERADAAGRCVLGVLGAYDYDASTGVLKENPATAHCQYAQARSADAAASAQPPGYLG